MQIHKIGNGDHFFAAIKVAMGFVPQKVRNSGHRIGLLDRKTDNRCVIGVLAHQGDIGPVQCRDDLDPYSLDRKSVV